MSESVIARLKASPVRRGFGLFVMMLLGIFAPVSDGYYRGGLCA